jgi:hypothetical protein
MKHGIGIFILMIVMVSASAQKDTTGVVVHKDPRIEMLVKKQIEYNEFITREARSKMMGFRIMIMSTNDQNKATSAKSKAYQEFPELRTYLHWQAPFYKVKVGNFKTREEAEEYIEHVKRIFPSGVYVVRETIEVNPDKSAELQ